MTNHLFYLRTVVCRVYYVNTNFLFFYMMGQMLMLLF